MDEKVYWYWLCNIKGIGHKKIKKLLQVFESPYNIYKAKEKEYNLIKVLKEKDILQLIKTKNEKKLFLKYNQLVDNNIKLVTIDDECYPNRLKNIYDPPYVLYVRGQFPDQNKLCIAIVGARKSTIYGREMARYFARKLAENNVEIISGLAKGIDTAAHKGALESNGNTYGVLGNGLKVCYPKENQELSRQMGKKGGLITEYDLNILPNPAHFPLRNRIISGLSQGILVIEAAKKSGSLITVEMGLEQGREIFAIPGRVTDIYSEGTNNLIKMGAKLVSNVDDILEEFKLQINSKMVNDTKKQNKIQELLDKTEKKVYSCLSLEPKFIDDIANISKMNIQDIMHILFMLEMKGVVKQLPNKNFIINV